ncbi:MAG: MATE family efflux transporter [Candidatus Muiribacteriota bacterium]
MYVKKTLNIALPTMLGFAVNYAYQLVDAWWVAQLGPGAPTAIIISGAIFSLLMAANEIIGISTIPLFTKAFGRGDKIETGYVIFQGILLKFFIGIIFSLFFLFIINNLIFLYTKNPEIVSLVQKYGNIHFISLLFIMPYATMQTALRSIGEAKKTLFISLIATCINLVLDPLFIFGAGEKATIACNYFEKADVAFLGAGSNPLFGFINFPSLGIRGAAFATVLTQFTVLLISFYFLLNNNEKIKIFCSRYVKFDKNLIIKMLTIGIPGGAIAFIFNFENNFITSIAANYGVAISDGFGIAAKIRGIMFMTMFGLSIGASISAGQYIGAKKFNEIRSQMKNLIFITILMLSILCIPIFIFAPQIIKFFSQEPLTIRSGSIFLRFFAVLPYLISTCMLLESVFTGAGKNIPRLFATISMVLGFEFPVLYITHHYFNLPFWGIGVIMLITGTIFIIVDIFLFKSRIWEKS